MKTKLNLIFAAGMTCALFAPSIAEAAPTYVYLMRHAEDSTNIIEVAGELEYECPSNSCCIEGLNDLGHKRAELWAGYVDVNSLDRVYASHKSRTQETVASIAADAQLAVQQLPPSVDECTLGYESSSASRDPMIAEIQSLPQGTTALFGAHSGTIYPIMEAFGIDTSDPVMFPRSSSGKVAGHQNFWELQIKSNGNVNVWHSSVSMTLEED